MQTQQLSNDTTMLSHQHSTTSTTTSTTSKMLSAEPPLKLAQPAPPTSTTTANTTATATDSSRASNLSGFYKLEPAERVTALERSGCLASGEGFSSEASSWLMTTTTTAATSTVTPTTPTTATTTTTTTTTSSSSIESRMSDEVLDSMGENVVGRLELPLCVATNFIVNGVDYVVPMVTEESSVVAAASLGAKLARPTGGFTCECGKNIATAQVLLVPATTNVDEPESPSDWDNAEAVLDQAKDELIAIGNAARPSLVKRGCGVVDLSLERMETKRGPMIAVSVDVDVGAAMGANTVNTIAEALGPHLALRLGGVVRMSIVTNASANRMVTATAEWTAADLAASVARTAPGMSGDDVIEAILDADAFAAANPARATTANKGIMNGVSAVALALCQDTRALEAACHSSAAAGDGGYSPFTEYSRAANGNLRGTLTLPVPVGTVGGALRHPVARTSLEILGLGSAESLAATEANTNSANELACVIAAVGLAQNFAALRALVTGGLSGHMALHAKKLAMASGATGELIDAVADALTASGNITEGNAAAVYAKMCTIL